MGVPAGERLSSVLNLESRFLAERGLGLYRPTNLQEALEEIGQLNQVNTWSINDGHPVDSREIVAYFLGQEVAGHLWRTLRPSPATPFSGFERISLPRTVRGQDVLLLGCAGVESYKLAQDKLKRIGVSVFNHWTVDISALPLRRIAAAEPGTIDFQALNQATQDHLLKGIIGTPRVLLQQDAASLSLPDGSIDLVTADLFFGSQAEKTEARVLAEVARVTKKGGQFVWRASIISDDNVREFAPDKARIGSSWNDLLRHCHGDGLAGRDNYIGLTSGQWEEFGALYSKFIMKYYFNGNRFRSLDQLIDFTQGSGQFVVREMVTQNVIIGRTEDPIRYAVVRAEKVV